jgi:hypothetical protein
VVQVLLRVAPQLVTTDQIPFFQQSYQLAAVVAVVQMGKMEQLEVQAAAQEVKIVVLMVLVVPP